MIKDFNILFELYKVAARFEGTKNLLLLLTFSLQRVKRKNYQNPKTNNFCKMEITKEINSMNEMK